MSQPQHKAELDPAMVEAMVTAAEHGPLDPATVTAMFPGREAEARAALEALQSYEAALGEARAAHRSERPPSETPTAPLPQPHTAPPPTILIPGTRLGDYTILDLLGHGAMGHVYRAVQHSLGNRTVALKVLSPALLDHDPRYLQRFHREAELAARIHHAGVAEVYGSGSADGRVFFAMRLVAGQTLQAVIDGLPETTAGGPAIDVRACVRLVRTLADALAAVHQVGLVHRDVKPANVVLEAPLHTDPDPLAGHPVLVDFGLLRPVGSSDLTGSQTVLGTPAFTAPECRLGHAADARADVFSLGATLHDLLTGTRSGGRGPASAGLPDPRRQNPAVDERLCAIVALATDQDRDRRYEDGAAFRDELDRWLRGDELRALPRRPLARARAWVRRDPRRGAVTVTIALLVGACLVAAFWALTLSVWGLSETARLAAGAEAKGDLAVAADAHRQVWDQRGLAGMVPWLGDARARAADYWHPQGRLRPLRECVAPLADGPPSGLVERDSTERQFAFAHDRLCEFLLDPSHQDLADLLHRFLWREACIEEPDYRRQLAFGTWTNYLSLIDHRVPLPDGLERLLQDLVEADRQPPLPSATRYAAISLLGMLRTGSAFATLVDLLDDPDLEALRLAQTGSVGTFTWLHRNDLPAYLALPAELIAAWANTMHKSGRFTDEGWEHMVAWRELDLEERAPPLRLPLHPATRAVVEDAKAWLLAKTPEFGHLPAQDDLVGGDLERYQQAAGLVRRFRWEDVIWRDPKVPDPSSRAEIRREAEATSWGRVDFKASPPTECRPFLEGTITEVAWDRAQVVPWESGAGCYLKLLRPGRTWLRVRSRVPENAGDLRVRIEHILGTRPNLPGGGRALLRLRLEDSSFALECEPPHANYNEVLIADRYLRGREEIVLVLEYVQGNTTARVDRIGLHWR